MQSDLSTTLDLILPSGECVACTGEANLICLVVSHSERKRLRQVTRGQLSSVIVWRATARCAVEGDWDLDRMGRKGGLFIFFLNTSVFKSFDNHMHYQQKVFFFFFN